MVSLIDLPAELLEKVLLHVPLSGLVNLSTTCKSLHGYLSPRVYHTFDWCWKQGDPSPPFHLLLRTLISNRLLAGYVKVLRLRGGHTSSHNGRYDGSCRTHWWGGSCEHEDSLCYPYEQGQTVVDATRRLGPLFKPLELWCLINIVSTIEPSKANEWYAGFDKGSIDIILSLILYQCQAVEQLDVGTGYLQHSQFIPKVFRRLMDRGKAYAAYPHLKHVELGMDGPSTPMGLHLDLDLFRIFLTLPQILHLDTILTEPAVFTWVNPSTPPRSESLTTLILRTSTVSEYALERILSCTPKLKRLDFDFYRLVSCDSWQSYKDNYEVSPQTISSLRPRHIERKHKVGIRCPPLSAALQHVANTLESLVLRVQFQSDSTVASCGMPVQDWTATEYQCHLVGRVTGLDKMRKLKSLETSWALLFGWWNAFLKLHPTDFDYWYKGMDPWGGVPGATANPWSRILPPGIEMLRLRDDMSNHSADTYRYYPHDDYPHRDLDPFKLTQHLLSIRRISYEHLKQLDFLFIWRRFQGHPVWPEELKEQLGVLCRTEGLRCEVTQDVEPK